MTEQEYYTTSHLGYAYFAMKHGFKGVQTLWYSDDDEKEEWRDGLVQENSRDTDDDFYYYSVGVYRFPKTPHNVALMKKIKGDIVVDCYGCPGEVIKRPDGCLEADFGEGSCRDLDALTILSRPINGELVPMPVWDKEVV
jgi:hypothetical protein